MFSPIPDILADLRLGRMVILTDDEARENEGDLVLPAQFVTPEAVSFMLSVARGYMCLSLTGADCDRLDLHPQAAVNTTVRSTAFTVSIDGHPRHGFTTGVSAPERARTIRMAIDPAGRPNDFVRPGHINPLRSRDGGVLVRTGQTEGSIDLCRLAGLYPAAVIIEVLREDGEMARRPDLERLCQRHGLKMCSVAQIIEYRLARESLVRRLAPERGQPVRTKEGVFNLIAFESLVDPLPHVALTVGGVGDLTPIVPHASQAAPSPTSSPSPVFFGAAPAGWIAGSATGLGGLPSGIVSPLPPPIEIAEPVLVRMHRTDLLGDVFGDLDSSPEGSTGETLRESMRAVQRAGRGVVVYLHHEGVGDGLSHRLMRIRRPGVGEAGHEGGSDAPDLTHPDGPGGGVSPLAERYVGIGSQILRGLGLRKLRLLTDHSKAVPGLEAFGLEIVERVPIPRS